MLCIFEKIGNINPKAVLHERLRHKRKREPLTP